MAAIAEFPESEVTPLATSAGTNLSATLVDANGLTWAGARVVATLQLAPGTSAPITWNDAPCILRYELLADATGYFIINGMPDNLSIIPAGTSWHFSIAPSIDNAVSVQFNIITSVATMDISPSFKSATAAQIPKLVQSFAVPRASSTSELATNPNDGQLFFNTTDHNFYHWNQGAWKSLTAAAAGYPAPGIAVSTGTAWNASIPANDVARLSLANTFTQPVTLSADPTAALGAATKQYTDTKLPLAGGTITGTAAIQFGDAYNGIYNPGGSQLYTQINNSFAIKPYNSSNPLFRIYWSSSVYAAEFAIPLNLTSSLQWATSTNLADNTDLNSISGNGLYAIAAGALNGPPITDIRSLFVFQLKGTDSASTEGILQLAYGYNDTSHFLYKRIWAGTWSAWVHLSEV